jgi:hypothetical protein
MRRSSQRTRKRVALHAVAAIALLSAAAAAGAGTPAPSCYPDAVGDAGDAPDIAWVTIEPRGAALEVDVHLAAPSELGPYGWLVVGIDTDRNPYTGGGRGDELLTFTNGDGTTLTRWVDGHFTSHFLHRPFHAALSSTDLTLEIARADLHARSFEFSVASLRQAADLAPARGVASYPRRTVGSRAAACARR